MIRVSTLACSTLHIALLKKFFMWIQSYDDHIIVWIPQRPDEVILE